MLACLIVAASAFSGCASARKDSSLAQKAVDVFHSQLDSEQYSLIYESADAKLRETTSEADFVRLLHNVHSELGTVRSSVLEFRGIGFHSKGKATVRLDYNTRFMRGLGAEEFVWQIRDNRAILFSYKINSKELAAK